MLELSGFLSVNTDKCTGCRTCELVCSMTHVRECNPQKSRIHVKRMKMEGVMIPVYCRQCVKPQCAKNCPVKAIKYNEKDGIVRVNYDLCIGCKNCIHDCPFGAMTWETNANKVIKCDLCSGKPQCVRYCMDGALVFNQFNNAGREKRERYALSVADSHLNKSKEK